MFRQLWKERQERRRALCEVVSRFVKVSLTSGSSCCKMLCRRQHDGRPTQGNWLTCGRRKRRENEKDRDRKRESETSWKPWDRRSSRKESPPSPRSWASQRTRSRRKRSREGKETSTATAGGCAPFSFTCSLTLVMYVRPNHLRVSVTSNEEQRQHEPSPLSAGSSHGMKILEKMMEAGSRRVC